MMRRVAIDALRNDPDWNGGSYTKPPTHWQVTAPFGPLMTESVARLQEMAPAVAAGDKLVQDWHQRLARADANDALWGTEVVEDYDPAPDLGRIRTRVLAINSADDQVNPPELHTVELAIARIPQARFVLIPAGPRTHGHYTYVTSDFWASALATFLETFAGTAGRNEGSPLISGCGLVGIAGTHLA